MSVCLLIIDDGRENYLSRCLASLTEQADTDDFDTVVSVLDHEHKLGFAGAIQAGWSQVVKTDCEWVFHVESDFVFTAPVQIEKMIAHLKAYPHLAQVSLKRQAVNERERAAGGIIEADPDDFKDCCDYNASWVEHQRYFTTNPSLYPARLCEMGWPQVPNSEGIFTHMLLAADYSFAVWGAKWDAPRVEHIGAVRAGHGY